MITHLMQLILAITEENNILQKDIQSKFCKTTRVAGAIRKDFPFIFKTGLEQGLVGGWGLKWMENRGNG